MLINKIVKFISKELKEANDALAEDNPILKDLRLRNEIIEKIEQVISLENDLLNRKYNILNRINDIEFYGMNEEDKEELETLKYELNKEKISYIKTREEIVKLRTLHPNIYMSKEMITAKATDDFKLDYAEKVLKQIAPRLIDELLFKIDTTLRSVKRK
jgi:hypothetical protein